MEIFDISRTGLMTIYVDKPLAVPNWPSEGGLSQEEAIKEFDIEEYVKI